MKKSHDHFLEMAAAYALDSISGMEREVFEAHLAEGCPQCADALDAYAASAAAIGAGLAPVAAPPGLKSRLMAEIGGGGPAETPAQNSAQQSAQGGTSEKSGGPWLAASGVLALTALLLGFLFVKTRADLDEQGERIANLEAALAACQEGERIWERPGATIRDFTQGPQPFDGAGALATVRVAWDRDADRAVVLFAGLSTGPDEDYELWVLDDAGTPRSVGVIPTGEGGTGRMVLEGLARPTPVSALAISLEAKGGSPDPNAPAGPVGLVAPMGG